MDLLAPPFTVGDFVDGYAVREVDEFVLRAREALRRDPSPMSENDVERTRFTTVSGIRGYERRQVDAWMVAVAAELTTREGGDRHDARLQFGPGYTFGSVEEDPPELRGVSAGSVGVRVDPSATTWVRVTALLVLVALVACYGLSYL